MTQDTWKLWGTDDPTGRTIWQRTAPDDGGITGKNSGKGAVETEIRAPDGTVLLNSTDSFDWEYWGGVHVTLNPDGETALLDINNQEHETWRLATHDEPQKLLECWRIVGDEDMPHYNHHPDGWRVEAKVLRLQTGVDDPVPIIGHIKVTDPNGQTVLNREVRLRSAYPHSIHAKISEDTAAVEVYGVGDGAERVTLPIPTQNSQQDTE